jgi:hypothetical protein
VATRAEYDAHLDMIRDGLKLHESESSEDSDQIEQERLERTLSSAAIYSAMVGAS